ncbi:TetR/AcrR family transcriptional regulator [Streptomyces sp. NPDC006422]|uniref:TetR/AcrR family transcriptional regulator n=1 Tax=unclassified Streptomyces TaxID=2593676 RepID=UPI0033A83DD6
MDLPLDPKAHSSMPQKVGPEPQRRNSRANRERILAVAREELGRNANASLDEIARAAGVVRRTLYGHFPGRQALLEALAEEAKQTLSGALAAPPVAADSPVEALARFMLQIWSVGDRYRMLISLAHRDLGVERVADVLEPARTRATAILERGQREGVFLSDVPAPALAPALEALGLSLLESTHSGAWEGTGAAAARTTLIAAGVPPVAAEKTISRILSAG